MARLWMSGFEAGHMDVFDTYDGAEVSAEQARVGGYSLKLSSDTDYARADFPVHMYEIYCRFAVRPDYASGRVLMVLRDSAGEKQITVLLNRYIPAIQVKRGSYTGTLLATGGCIRQDKWHCIEFRLLVSNSGGAFLLKVNGTQVISFIGDTQATANANVKSFQIGESDGLSVTGYYDDLAFNDLMSAVNNSWIGRGGISAILPTGAGASTDLDLYPDSGEANWEDVDETPPDTDESYVFDTVVDEHDSYVASDLALPGSISAIQWLARARSGLSDTPAIARILRIDGTDYQGDDMPVDIWYDYCAEILDRDPDAGPGAWTKAVIDAMEIGVMVR